jgi:electron transfer flavoprotein beta subunit
MPARTEHLCVKILVVLRAVVDASDELPLVEGALDEDSLQFGPSEFDEAALEEALHLQEAAGATVVVVALATAGDRILHTALARGADREIRLNANVPLAGGSLALSAALAPVAREQDIDLVLTGVQAPDDIFGQLAPLLAARLGWPQASGVGPIERAADGRIDAIQELEGGRTVRLTLSPPAVLGVQTSRQVPRYVSATKLKQAMQNARIEAMEISVPEAGRARMVAIARPQSGNRIQMLSDDAEQASGELVKILTAQGQ